MNYIFLYSAVFLFGSIIGSFLNVCIYRIPRGISIIVPSSRCPLCNTPVPFWDNVPLLSYLFLKGRCRFCREKISLKYPFVELLNALLYVFILWRFGTQLSWFVLFYFAFLSSLLVITFIDMEYQIIPNSITLPGIVMALFFGSTILPDPFSRSELMKAAPGTGAFTSMAGILLGGGLFYLIAVIGKAVFKKDAMGGGDIKMMAMVGGFLGWKGVLLTTFLGSLVGSLAGISFIIVKGRQWGSKIPFGPYLALGAIMSLFFGQEIIRWYLYAG